MNILFIAIEKDSKEYGRQFIGLLKKYISEMRNKHNFNFDPSAITIGGDHSNEDQYHIYVESDNITHRSLDSLTGIIYGNPVMAVRYELCDIIVLLTLDKKEDRTVILSGNIADAAIRAIADENGCQVHASSDINVLAKSLAMKFIRDRGLDGVRDPFDGNGYDGSY